MNQVMIILIESIVIFFAILSTFSRNLFRSGIYLLSVFFFISIFYFVLGLNYLGAVQLIIYVGGIIILLIFSIFLTKNIDKKLIFNSNKFVILASCLVFAFFCIYLFLFKHSKAEVLQNKPDAVSLLFENTSETEEIRNYGQSFLDINQPYLVPMEVTSLLLLIILIGCILILKNGNNLSTNKNNKHVDLH
ncbi:MAG: NADH-quinone oxidoreductase subunit J [Alphaproteobacteria bacterium]|nr:NADH-quinone oxidoreductase subunit J [Alphaproteobacteria bacterium]